MEPRGRRHSKTGHRPPPPTLSTHKTMDSIEHLRRALYASCRAAGLEIVPKDTGARVMAFVGLQGGDERTVVCPRLRCELQHLQELYHLQGGEVPDADFVRLVQDYTQELEDYTSAHSGAWPEWLNALIRERYGFTPYTL